MNWPASVAKAVGKARDEVRAVQKKTGGNAAYTCQSWDEVVPALRDACEAAGLIISPSIVASSMDLKNTNSGGVVECWKVVLEIELTSIEDGGSVVKRWEGQANDSGDKGEQKAATSAYKYWALKTFQIPTHEDKTDNDGINPEPLAQVKRAPSAKPAPERPNTEPQTPAQPAKPTDPLKTAKVAVKNAAQPNGLKGGDVWKWFEAGRPEPKVVMSWADMVASELTVESAASKLVSLYMEELRAIEEETPIPVTAPAIEAEDPFEDE